MSSNPVPYLVLLHGYCENHSIWEGIMPFINYEGTIKTPDLPGFGRNPLSSPRSDLNDIASQLHDELISEGVSNCICIGHSLGDYIVLHLKKQYPNFVTKLGLVNSTALNDSPEKKEARSKLIAFLNNHPARDFLSTFANTLFSETNQDRLKQEIETVRKMSDGVDSTTLQVYARAMRDRVNMLSILTNENAPLFVAGECDNAVPIENSQEQLKFIKDHRNCYILKNVAHMSMYENPQALIEGINRFVK